MTEESTDEYKSEEEVYVGQRKQPYTINRKEARSKPKQSESIKELNLCSRKITPKPAPMEIDSEPEVLLPVPTSKPKRPRTKVQPSIVDQLPGYDISEDILSTPAKATIGQMLQYPNQRKNLVKILKRSKQPVETNYLTSDDSRKTTAAKYCIRIKGNPVMAILDSGAAVSIMTDKLRRKLRLEIDSLSKTVVITADGT